MTMTIERAASILESIRAEVGKAFKGQDEVLEQVLLALAASGHVLVEGLPGLGKTLLTRAAAASFGGDAKRVQFTPDLMPHDITGHSMYDLASGKFVSRKGPVFTHILIADEINRAPAKTQAALLEVMQEYQVSFDGETHALQRPFMVLATQNPAEHEGTYPLPDAQLDRFLLKVLIDYPEPEAEREFVSALLDGKTGDSLDIAAVRKVASVEDLAAVQEAVGLVKVDPEVVGYAVGIAGATRSHRAVRVGAGPRASLALVRLARAKALSEGREYATPDDVRRWALPVLRHRVVPAVEWEIDGRSVDDAVSEILGGVEAPRK